ncbi:DUF2254 domain-containing protein [Salipiger sp.]|uniref:DUF2254 domain-containing protein n=1 Tax=Salipiger sp. TaxID=2078585 RepID=UPI003A96D37F
MFSKPLMILRRVSNRLAVRVLFGSILAFAAVLLAPFFDSLIPESWQDRFGRDAVMPILTILASSMLTVTTFSLSVMVQAFRSAASQATPRAYRLHLSDTTTHTALATFTAAFLFSLTAIVMFNAGFYSEAAAVVIFWLTMLVIAAIVLAMLRWIDHLSRLGSMDHTLETAESAAFTPLAAMMDRPALGGQPILGDLGAPKNALALPAPRGGYVQFIDMNRMQTELGKSGARLRVAAAPGHHVIRGQPLGWLMHGEDVDRSTLVQCFTLGNSRSLEQDARFGVMILNEIAVRALSPAVNDPGTAIDVVQRLTRLLGETGRPAEEAPEFGRIEVPMVAAFDLMDDAFGAIIRDGAGRPEVISVVFSALNVLQGSPWTDLAKAARRMRGYAVRHANETVEIRDDRDRLAEKAR